MFNSVGRLVTKLSVKMKKNAPELWLGAGIVLLVTDAVLAVKAGSKLKDTVQPHYEVISDRKEQILTLDPEKETKEIALVKKEINKEQLVMFKDLSILFAPVVLSNAAACFCMFKCYKTLKAWNTGLVVAYNALLDAYTAYRTNNIAMSGEEYDRDVLLNGQIVDLTDPNNPDGEVVRALKVGRYSTADMYGRIFSDETSSMFSSAWYRNPQYMLDFIRLVEMTTEEKRQRVGFASFSDALMALGYKEIQAYTYLHGWDKTPVSFGLGKYDEDTLRDIKLGKYTGIRLEFNCDGLIIWAMDNMKE